MERWPLVEVRMFIYIVLKPKVTGVNMYVNSQHLYIKDWCLLGLLFPSQPCPRYNSLKFLKLENYTFISKVNRKGDFFNNTVKPFYKGHLEDRGKRPLYGEVSVRVKHDTDIFMGFNSFVVKKSAQCNM